MFGVLLNIPNKILTKKIIQNFNNISRAMVFQELFPFLTYNFTFKANFL